MRIGLHETTALPPEASASDPTASTLKSAAKDLRGSRNFDFFGDGIESE